MHGFSYRLFLCFICALCGGIPLHAQTSNDYVVPLTAQVQTSPPQIMLQWPPAAGATGYTLYRKSRTTGNWGTAIASLAGTAGSYTDTNVLTDSAYEYKILEANPNLSAFGYIYAGLRYPAFHDKGILYLLVDSLFADSLPQELLQFREDLRGDGWQPLVKVCGRHDSVISIKTWISNEYALEPVRSKALLLLGHIPVPYSGDINPDGHPDHLGAWPADVYYADVDGFWSDFQVEDSGASRPENRNIFNDGKYDQSMLPSNTELQVSRIDFNNMPSFPHTEVQLMRSYLRKDHRYRNKLLVLPHRGLYDDNFGAFGGEAFASNGLRNFAPLVGTPNVYNLDFISTLDTAGYQWAYGCGGGWFQGSGGIGSTTNFVNDSVKAIFTMLFGSYFGDWDSQDNFLRAPLCADDPALTCCWAGRPYWFFHHMAMGENIGYSAQLSQNNNNTYPGNYGMRFVHIALMGDLTLKEDAVAPVQNYSIFTPGNGMGAHLNWSAPNDTVIGYYVYRSDAPFGQYRLISPLLTLPDYIDTVGSNGMKYYLVRAAKLQQTPSGTYINLSEGLMDSLEVQFPNHIASAAPERPLGLYPDPATSRVTVSFHGVVTGQLTIENMMGAVIYRQACNAVSSLQLDVSAFGAGTYLVKLTSDGKVCYAKLEVIR